MILWLKNNWFMFGILICLGLGLLFPGLAVLNPAGKTSKTIVILLFLGIGFTLPGTAIITDLKNFKLHGFIQVFLFIITPLFFVGTTSFLDFPQEIRIGILALSVLPTTVSTCIVFT